MRRKDNRTSNHQLRPQVWASARVFEIAHRLNWRCVEWLAGIAETDEESAMPDIVRRYGHLWFQMDARARQRAARIPIVLFDFRFLNSNWWHRIIHVAPMAMPRRDLVGGDTLQLLVREVLMEARTTIVAEPRAARLVFGMTPIVAMSIAALTSVDIDVIAARHAQDLRPRWADRRVFWQNLLLAALGEDDAALSDVHLHSFQLLGSDLAHWRN